MVRFLRKDHSNTTAFFCPWSRVEKNDQTEAQRILSLPGTEVVTLFIIPQNPDGLLCTSPFWNIILRAIAILK
jgi:hypothetical protein